MLFIRAHIEYFIVYISLRLDRGVCAYVAPPMSDHAAADIALPWRSTHCGSAVFAVLTLKACECCVRLHTARLRLCATASGVVCALPDERRGGRVPHDLGEVLHATRTRVKRTLRPLTQRTRHIASKLVHAVLLDRTLTHSLRQ